jgi:predicted AAA+ superfamily ATPase
MSSFLAKNEHMISRLLSSSLRKSSKSVLLLGPRQVGKSTLIKALKPELEINLADEAQFLRYASDPAQFRDDILGSECSTIFIDEIQRLPRLLNSIQAIIDDNRKLKFYLTGSSARKLRRGEANLLPGRILRYNLGPLVASELDYKLNTNKALEVGTLPEVYLEKSRELSERLLKTYAGVYLAEEIKAESLVRDLNSFARFLSEVGVLLGTFIDLTKLAQRAKISRHAAPRYFEILEDSMIGRRLYPFTGCEHGIDLVKHPKFYLFDNGVANGMLGNFTASRDRIGILAEQLVLNQLVHSAWAHDADITVSTFRTRGGLEVDYIVELSNKLFAIEVKSSDDIVTDDLTGLGFFHDQFKGKVAGAYVFHMGKTARKFGKIWSLPWQEGLREMGL